MTSPRRIRRSPFLASAAALYFIGISGCEADGLIGGECADGYAYCRGECIPVLDDESNCGGCDLACSGALECIEGICGGPAGSGGDDMGGMPGSGGDQNAGGTGGVGGNPSGGMGGAITGGTGGASIGGTGGATTGGSGGMATGGTGGDGTGGDGTGGSGTGGGGPCLPPFVTAAACGDCATQCSGGTPNCAPDGIGGYECVAMCTSAPYVTQCGDSCVDTETDPRHCGTCDNRCPSGICAASTCVGDVSGHMVAICMSFEQPATSPTKLLSNAVFLASENPVRILAYVRDTSSAVEAGTEASLVQAAISKGRSFLKTEVTSNTAIEMQLNRTDFDVLLVFDQDEAPAGDLAALGASTAATVQTFAQQGGVVVVLTGGGGTSEMDDLIDAWGIANVGDTVNYDGGTYRVDAPGDAVGINVVSPFLGVTTSCTFSVPGMPSADVVYVVTASDMGPNNGDPAVIHQIVTP